MLFLFSCTDQVMEIKIPNGTLKEKLTYIENSENFNNESERINALFEVYYQYKLESSPFLATMLGKEEFNHLWDDYSPEGTQKNLENLQLLVNSKAWFQLEKLNQEDALNFDLFLKDIESQNDLNGQYPEQYLIIDQIQGLHNQMAGIIQLMPTNNKKSINNIISRLEGIPKLVEDIQITLQEGIEKGIVMPTNTVINVPNQIDNLISHQIEKSVFFTPFAKLELKINNEGGISIQDQAIKIITEEVNPSLEAFQKFIKDEYLPATRSSYGLSALPNGEDWYQERIRFHTTTELTAKEIHELGKTEVARILKEMENILVRLNFKGSLSDFNTFLKEDPQFYFDTPEELLIAYRDICKRIDPELPKLFGKLPRLTYGVVPVPAYSEKSTTTAYYMPGSPEAGIPGSYYANTYDLKSRPSWEMEALSIHEAVPGHHFQISLAQELENVPKFRSMLMFTAFVEGWGLYSESLGPDMGLYKSPYSKYGQLTYEMWRAIRLVVDTGIHAFGWSRADAIAYFQKHSGKAEHDIAVEVDRYIAWPGQALAYKIGELKIKELRSRSEETLKDQFDVRDFHDVVLGSGTIPLDLLEKNVDRWIAEQSTSE